MKTKQKGKKQMNTKCATKKETKNAHEIGRAPYFASYNKKNPKNFVRKNTFNVTYTTKVLQR
jgi:hypothetical protein